jgi:mono/diheme cytochrome c family protein
MKPNFKFISIATIGALAILQILPLRPQFTNPPISGEPSWDTPRTKELFNRACADCHSHETKYPWYSNVAPVSWLVAHDINEGREHFNVSTWGVQKKNEGEDATKEVREGKMPIWIYTLTHPEANLNGVEKQELIVGLEKTFGKKEIK